MNWGLIWWIAGGVATMYAIKFVFDVFSNLFGKEQRKALIAKMGDTVHEANENFTESVKKKCDERRQRKAAEKSRDKSIRYNEKDKSVKYYID